MVRKVTPAQFRAMVQKAQADRRRAIDNYNSEVRKANQAIADHNRKAQRAADTYNREVRAHNSRVRANRQRLRSEISRFNSQRSVTHYTAVQSSTITLQAAYQLVDRDSDTSGWDVRGHVLADMAEAEAANSVRVANTLLGEAAEAEFDDTSLTDELSALSSDLDNRWRGALYALNDRNPDAARHFCTSSREVIAQMIDLRAPDEDVMAARPNLVKINGQVPRRDKIGYLLDRFGASQQSLGDFVEADVNDVMNLFSIFNSATHGEAGRFDIPALRAIKGRVEGAVRFLSTVIRGGDN